MMMMIFAGNSATNSSAYFSLRLTQNMLHYGEMCRNKQNLLQ